MRREDKQIKDMEVIHTLLREAQVCRIGLCEDNIPYVVPMNFGFDGRYLYLHSATEGRKIDMMRKNDRVCFEIDSKHELVTGEEACNWSMKYYSVIGYGRAEFIEGLDDKKKALNTIMEKYSGRNDFNFPEAAVNKVAVIRIDIEELTGKKSRY